jgi:hypothetical protein
MTTSLMVAVMDAHEVGHNPWDSKIGRDGKNPPGYVVTPKGLITNYTDAQIREKFQILKSAGADRKTIQKLMDSGVVGHFTTHAQLSALGDGWYWTGWANTIFYPGYSFQYAGRKVRVTEVNWNGDAVVVGNWLNFPRPMLFGPRGEFKGGL